MDKYDINDYLKGDKELQKAVIEEFLKEIAELKAENEALIEGLGIANKYVNKYHQTLQVIKEIAEALSCKNPEDCWENTPDWNGEVYGCDVAENWTKPSDLATCPSKLASAILQIITKAEEE